LETQGDRNLSTGFKTGFIYVNWASHGVTKANYEGWNFNSGNYLFTTDTK